MTTYIRLRTISFFKEFKNYLRRKGSNCNLNFYENLIYEIIKVSVYYQYSFRKIT